MVIGYLGAVRILIFDPRSSIFHPLRDLRVLAVNLFGWGGAWDASARRTGNGLGRDAPSHGEPGRPRSHERGYGERRGGYGVGQAAALGRFRSDGRKTSGGLLMDDGFLANPARVSRGILGYLLLVIGGRCAFSSSILDL